MAKIPRLEAMTALRCEGLKMTELGSKWLVLKEMDYQENDGFETIQRYSPLGVRLLAGDVEQEIGRESEDLLARQHVESVERSVAKVVFPVDLLVLALWDGEVGAGLGDVDFILLHRSVVGVVAVVGDSPREVGSPHEGVCDETDDVADGTVSRERAMSSLHSVLDCD
jgi:hypothetical protein